MARWKLTAPHYLNVPGTEWEYKESDRETGRSVRKVYHIPLHLNPDLSSDWNYRDQEAIIVSSRVDPLCPRDIVFVGPPTPDMEPLDDEARRISQEYVDSGRWKHPIESMNMTYSQSLLTEFEQKIALHLAGMSKPTEVPRETDLDRLQKQLAELMERNARLEEQLSAKSTGVTRRA